MTFVAILLLLFLAAADAIWFVRIFCGIWRSAGRNPGMRIWALFAGLGVSSGAVRMTGEVFLIASLA